MCCGCAIEPFHCDSSFDHPKQTFKLIDQNLQFYSPIYNLEKHEETLGYRSWCSLNKLINVFQLASEKFKSCGWFACYSTDC